MFKGFIVVALLSFAMSIKVAGLDVSTWQGTGINWNSVKSSGRDFAIIRGGYGTGNIDNTFEVNYQNAHAAGVDLGFYWYSYASNGAQATGEANSILSILSGKKFEYPIYYDIEEQSIFSSGNTNQIAKNFCAVLEQHKYFCGIYSSKSQLDSYFSSEVKNRYSIWVAQWSSSCTYSGPYGIWQYSSTGSVPGISGNVDLDYAYEDFPTIMKQAHLNGY